MIKLNQDVCTGCGLCLKKCLFGAIQIIDSVPVFSDSCTFCGACVDACKFDAIKIHSDGNKRQGYDGHAGFWVIMQLDSKTQSPKKVSYELLSKARELAVKIEHKVAAVCLCAKEPEGLRQNLQNVGCDELVLVENDKLAEYDTELFTYIISDLIVKNKPYAVLFSATEDGRDLAPRLSARLKVGLTADCTGLDLDEENHLIQIRPTYGGSVIASIVTPYSRPQMATIRPNVFSIINIKQAKPLKVKHNVIFNSINDSRIKHIGFITKEVVYKDVSEAEIVISGGYGLGGENFKLLNRLAVITGAAVGASRKAVDEGWASFDIQIGQTGKTIAPDLYLAFGISGALQHSIGIKNAKKIIAVNNDPAAPIFSICDIAILGDAHQVLSNLIEIAEKKR